MQIISKPSVFPESDPFPVSVANCLDSVVEFYDDALEGRTAVSFADVKTMFRFGFSMFRSSDAARNREIMEFLNRKAPCTAPSIKSLYQEYLETSDSDFRVTLGVFTSCLRLFREFTAVSEQLPEIVGIISSSDNGIGAETAPESDGIAVTHGPTSSPATEVADTDAAELSPDIVQVITSLPDNWPVRNKRAGSLVPGTEQPPLPATFGRAAARSSRIHIRFGDLKIDFASTAPEDSVARVLSLLSGRAG